jgi:hypothetical protein
VHRVVNISEVLIELLDRPEVRLSHLFRSGAEEVGMGILEELLELRLAGCSLRKGGAEVA